MGKGTQVIHVHKKTLDHIWCQNHIDARKGIGSIFQNQLAPWHHVQKGVRIPGKHIETTRGHEHVNLHRSELAKDAVDTYKAMINSGNLPREQLRRPMVGDFIYTEPNLADTFSVPDNVPTRLVSYFQGDIEFARRVQAVKSLCYALQYDHFEENKATNACIFHVFSNNEHKEARQVNVFTVDTTTESNTFTVRVHRSYIPSDVIEWGRNHLMGVIYQGKIKQNFDPHVLDCPPYVKKDEQPDPPTVPADAIGCGPKGVDVGIDHQFGGEAGIYVNGIPINVPMDWQEHLSDDNNVKRLFQKHRYDIDDQAYSVYIHATKSISVYEAIKAGSHALWMILRGGGTTTDYTIKDEDTARNFAHIFDRNFVKPVGTQSPSKVGLLGLYPDKKFFMDKRSHVGQMLFDELWQRDTYPTSRTQAETSPVSYSIGVGGTFIDTYVPIVPEVMTVICGSDQLDIQDAIEPDDLPSFDPIHVKRMCYNILYDTDELEEEGLMEPLSTQDEWLYAYRLVCRFVDERLEPDSTQKMPSPRQIRIYTPSPDSDRLLGVWSQLQMATDHENNLEVALQILQEKTRAYDRPAAFNMLDQQFIHSNDYKIFPYTRAMTLKNMVITLLSIHMYVTNENANNIYDKAYSNSYRTPAHILYEVLCRHIDLETLDWSPTRKDKAYG